MWATFAHLKHSTTPAKNGDALTSITQASSSHNSVQNAPTAPSSCTVRRPGRPSLHDVASVTSGQPSRDFFSVDYGLCPFDDREYAIVCTVTNHIVHTDMSLLTPFLTEEARHQVCIQYRGRCCHCWSSKHSLRWRPTSFQNIFSLLNPQFATHDQDGFTLEALMRRKLSWWKCLEFNKSCV